MCHKEVNQQGCRSAKWMMPRHCIRSTTKIFRVLALHTYPATLQPLVNHCTYFWRPYGKQSLHVKTFASP